MVKEIFICEQLQVPKNKLSRCRSEAHAFCKGEHEAKTFFCWEHLTQCPKCGDIFCSVCLEKHQC